MFLHSGASLHGHEYSNRPAPTGPGPRRSPLLRSPFTAPITRAASYAETAKEAAVGREVTQQQLDQPSTSSSNSAAFANNAQYVDYERLQVQAEAQPRPQPRQPPRPALTRPRPPRVARPLGEHYYPPTTRRTSEPVVRFREPFEEPAQQLQSEVQIVVVQAEAAAAGQQPPLLPVRVPGGLPLDNYNNNNRNSSVSSLRPAAPAQSVAVQQLRPLAAVQMSDDEGSLSASEYSDGNATNPARSSAAIRRKKRRTPRSRTTFLLAHPAPRLGAKARSIQIRPKLLLQIQQLSDDRRPRPTMDVYPSSLMAGPVAGTGGGGFAKRFPRLFRSRGGELGLHDVILVRSEDYDADPDDDEADHHLSRRELIAVLSPMRKREDRTELVLADGETWEAAPLHNGSYEFTHVDQTTGDKTTARWVRRLVTTTTQSTTATATTTAGGGSQTPSPSPSPTQEYRLTFSILNPLSRRHPILATMSNSTLDILDHYTTVSSSSGRYPPAAPSLRVATAGLPGGMVIMSDDEDAPEQRTTHPVDEATKTLITVSAVWVGLRMGWSPYFKPPSPSEVMASSMPAAAPTAGLVVGAGGGSGPPTPLPMPPAVTTAQAAATPTTTSRSRSQSNNSSEPGGGSASSSAAFSNSTRISTPDSVSLASSIRKPGPRSSAATVDHYHRDRSPAGASIAHPSQQPTAATTTSSNNNTPRRATSSGAAFMERRRASMNLSRNGNNSNSGSTNLTAAAPPAHNGACTNGANTDVSDAESTTAGAPKRSSVLPGRRRGRRATATRILSGEWNAVAAAAGLKRSLSIGGREREREREREKQQQQREREMAANGAKPTIGVRDDGGGHVGLHLPHMHLLSHHHHHHADHANNNAGRAVSHSLPATPLKTPPPLANAPHQVLLAHAATDTSDLSADQWSASQITVERTRSSVLSSTRSHDSSASAESGSSVGGGGGRASSNASSANNRQQQPAQQRERASGSLVVDGGSGGNLLPVARPRPNAAAIRDHRRVQSAHYGPTSSGSMLLSPSHHLHLHPAHGLGRGGVARMPGMYPVYSAGDAGSANDDDGVVDHHHHHGAAGGLPKVAHTATYDAAAVANGQAARARGYAADDNVLGGGMVSRGVSAMSGGYDGSGQEGGEMRHQQQQQPATGKWRSWLRKLGGREGR